MTRGRAALLLAPVAFATLMAFVVTSRPAFADEAVPAARPKQAILFLIDRVSFDELMAVPELRQIARAGGAGLMTTRVASAFRGSSSYLTIGAGTVTSPTTGYPLLMQRVLDAAGAATCEFGSASSVGVPSSPGRLVVDPPAGATTFDCGPRPAQRLDPSFPGGIRTDPRAMAALVAGAIEGSAEGAVLVVVDLGDTLRIDRHAPTSVPSATDAARRAALAADGRLVAEILAALPPRPTLVMVLTPAPSFDMRTRGDEVTPVVMATGSPAGILSAAGQMHALRSPSTRRDGLVSNVDAAPTVLDFFGVPTPAEMDGQPMEVTGAEAPFGLHRLELEYRRIRFPIQIAEVTLVAIVGIAAMVALAVLAVRGRVPAPVAHVFRGAALVGATFLLVLLAGGLLPRMSFAVVVPYVVVSMVLLTLLAARCGWGGPFGPFVFLGAVGLAFLLLDALFGGAALGVPLFGGTMFDGVRFYGLPNAFIALLLASSLFVAYVLDPFRGSLLLFGAGLFAGFPSLGANVGASITLFFAAGLWWALRGRGRVGWREALVVAGVTLGGLVLVLVASRVLPGTPTHASRFVERTGGRLGDLFAIVRDRLAIGFRQANLQPWAYVPLLGLPVVALVAARAPGGLRAGLTDRAWRDLIVALCLASVVAYFVNDTGVAAAAPAFLYAMAALTFPTMTAALAVPARAAP